MILIRETGLQCAEEKQDETGHHLTLIRALLILKIAFELRIFRAERLNCYCLDKAAEPFTDQF